MMGLMVVGAFGIYVIAIVVVAWLGVRFARRRGIAGWQGGLAWGLALFFLIFQDYVPSLVWHTYQCNFGDAGFRVYKTVEEWREENPGVWETLAPDALPEAYLVDIRETARNTADRRYRLPDGTELEAHFKADKLMTTRLTRPDGSEGYWINQRFIALNDETRGWFHVYRWSQEILDRLSGQPVARYVDYRSIVRLPAFAFLKARRDSCEENRSERKRFSEFYHLVKFKKEIDL